MGRVSADLIVSAMVLDVCRSVSAEAEARTAAVEGSLSKLCSDPPCGPEQGPYLRPLLPCIVGPPHWLAELRHNIVGHPTRTPSAGTPSEAVTFILHRPDPTPDTASGSVPATVSKKTR